MYFLFQKGRIGTQLQNQIKRKPQFSNVNQILELSVLHLVFTQDCLGSKVFDQLHLSGSAIHETHR